MISSYQEELNVVSIIYKVYDSIFFNICVNRSFLDSAS